MSASKEQARFTRLSRLLINIGTQVLKDQFDAIHPPSCLHSTLTSTANHHLLKTLKAKRIITVHQWHKLYPSVSGSVSSANFDITLLFLLLRNICGLSPPTSAVSSGSWDKLPAATDTSKEADLVRIKYYRNTIYGHITKTAVTDADFEQLWSEIEDVFLRLSGSSLQSDIQRLKVDAIDRDEAEYCDDILQDWEKNDKSLMDKLIEIEVMIKPTKKPKVSDVLSAEDADTYSEMLKSSITNQTENMPNYNSQLLAKMKTDEIFTSILVKHHKDSTERCRQNFSKSLLTSSYGIQNCSEIFVHKNDSNGNRPKKMLVSGQAGIGKTLFCHKLVRDWSKGVLFFNDHTTNHPDLKFTFLLTFRQINEINKNVNLSELLNLSQLLDSKSMTNDRIIEYFVQHQEQVLIVFDGLDESTNANDIIRDVEISFPNDFREKMPAAVLCSKLIKGKLLKDSTVLITSRPEEAALIQSQIPFDSYLEITGFNEGKVLEYVGKYFKRGNEETKAKVLATFKSSKILLSFARVPLLCFFACLYMEWNVDQSTDMPPTSLTEFYTTVIEHIEKNHNKLVLKAECAPVIDNVLDKLSEVAFDLIECQKYSFNESYLRNHLKLSTEDIAYVKSSNLLCCVIGVKQSPFDDVKYEYSFLHLTIQEFLAARHLLRSDKGIPYEGRWSDVILRFAAGLARKDRNEKFMFEVIEYSPKWTKHVNRINCEAVIKCLNEYGDKELVKLAIIRYENLVRRSIFPVMRVMSMGDLDCTGIALVLNAIAELRSQNIELSPASLFCALNITKSTLTSHGIQILCDSLGNSFCLVNDLHIEARLDGESISCLLEYLPHTNINSLDLNGNLIGDFVIPYKAHARNSIKNLCLGDNKLTDKSALGLIRHFPELRSLDLGSNFLTDKGLDSILHSGIIQLCLGGNKGITDEGAKAISNKCIGIKKLSLAQGNITDAGIIAIAHNCNVLLKLNLDSCKLTDDGAFAIAHNCTLLEEIDLSGTKVGYKGVLEIIKACKNMNDIKFPNGTLSPTEITDLYHLCKIRNIRCFCIDTISLGLSNLRGGNGRGMRINVPPEFAI